MKQKKVRGESLAEEQKPGKGKKLTIEQFTLQAIERLRKPEKSKGIHVWIQTCFHDLFEVYAVFLAVGLAFFKKTFHPTQNLDIGGHGDVIERYGHVEYSLIVKTLFFINHRPDRNNKMR